MTEAEFYEHEYSKHGTCSPFGEYEYFAKALELFKK
jgi:ribonuclease I